MRIMLSEYLSEMVNIAYESGIKITAETVEKLENAAEENDKIYHCTNIDALKSIIRGRQLWMSSLAKMNDPAELEYIERPEFRNKIFVASFTGNKEISDDHWDEYGSMNNGILIRFKKEWITGQFFVPSDDTLTIFCERGQADLAGPKEKIMKQFYLLGKPRFFKILYAENELLQQVSLPNRGVYIDSTAMGLTKHAEGESTRTGKTRRWADENEYRYKAIVKRANESGDMPFERIAVQLTEDCFNELEYRFAPGVSQEAKEKFLNEVQVIKPGIILKEI